MLGSLLMGLDEVFVEAIEGPGNGDSIGDEGQTVEHVFGQIDTVGSLVPHMKDSMGFFHAD